MNTSEFLEILVRVRDRLLRRMRREGFWYESKLRHDATPWDINNGLCDEFADSVMEEIYGHAHEPEDIDVGKDPYVVDLSEYDEELAHCAIHWHGRFYDAECVGGVRSWRRLPIVVNRWLERAQAIRRGKKC